jgi:hemolysin activation/secretion protein
MVRNMLLSVATITTFAFSQNLSLEQFLGIELGHETLNSKNVINASESNSGFNVGLKLGAQDYDWRTAFSAYYSKQDEQESVKAIISLDRYLFAGVYETEETIMKPYFGLHAGWLKYKDIGIKDDGLLYGAQIGFAWGLSGGVDFDLGYRRSFTAVDRVNSIGTFALSINYIF